MGKERFTWLKYGNYTVYSQMEHITFKRAHTIYKGVPVTVPSFLQYQWTLLSALHSFDGLSKFSVSDQVYWSLLCYYAPATCRSTLYITDSALRPYFAVATTRSLDSRTFILPIKNDFSIVNLCIFDVKHPNHLLVGSETRNKLWKQYQE